MSEHERSAVTRARSSYSWPAVTDVTRRGGLLVLWIGSGDGVVPPERAIADPAALLVFARTRLGRPRG